MPLYKLTKGSLGIVVDDKTVEIKKGQTIDLPSDEKAKSYSKYLRRVDLDVPKTAPETIPISTATAENTSSTVVITDTGSLVDWSTTQDMKAPDVIEMIKSTNSIDELNSLQKVEEDGQNRVGVLSAIEKRIKQLEQE